MLLPFRCWMTACVLIACGLFHGSAGDKKKNEPLLTKSGELKADDAKDKKLKNPAKMFTVSLKAERLYQFDLKSSDFDAYLRLEDAAGKQVAFNDDASSDTQDSRIVYKADATADFKVIVTSYNGKLGKFSLSAIEVEKQPLQTGSRFRSKTTIALKLKDGSVKHASELNEMDPSAQNRYYKLFTVELEKDKTYRIEHRADNQEKLDCFLFLEDADGVQLESNDDATADTFDSRIVHKAARTGVYRVIATSLGQNQVGRFTLEINPEKDAKEAKEADIKHRILNFAHLPGGERKRLKADLKDRFEDQGDDLALDDARLALFFATEVETVDVEMARAIYTDYIKLFAGAASKLLRPFPPLLQNNLKELDRLGKEIDISGKTLDGKDFDLKSLKGKVVLVEFWTSTSIDCRAETPNMLFTYERFHKKGFEIVGVSVDKADGEAVKFNYAHDIPWQSINIADGDKLARRLEVRSVPYSILVDGQRRVVSVRARGPQLGRLVERLLAEKG